MKICSVESLSSSVFYQIKRFLKCGTVSCVSDLIWLVALTTCCYVALFYWNTPCKTNRSVLESSSRSSPLTTVFLVRTHETKHTLEHTLELCTCEVFTERFRTTHAQILLCLQDNVVWPCDSDKKPARPSWMLTPTDIFRLSSMYTDLICEGFSYYEEHKNILWRWNHWTCHFFLIPLTKINLLVKKRVDWMGIILLPQTKFIIRWKK